MLRARRRPMPRRAILIVLALGVIVLLWLAWKWTVVRSGPVLSEDEDHTLAGDAAELVAPARPPDAVPVESRRAESPPSGERATPAAPFRGQVVDAATGEPVPDALVVAGSFQAMAEVEGT